MAIPDHRDWFWNCPIRLKLKSFADVPERCCFEFRCKWAVSVSGSVFAHLLWAWLSETIGNFSQNFVSLGNTGLLLVVPKQAERCSVSFLLLIAHTWRLARVCWGLRRSEEQDYSPWITRTSLFLDPWFSWERRRVGKKIGKALRQY